MFGISLPELLVVAVIALLVFGPEKLPQIASQLGKISFQLKKTSDSFRREFYNSVYKPVDEEKQNITGDLKIMKNEIKSLASVEADKSAGSNLHIAREPTQINPANKENIVSENNSFVNSQETSRLKSE